MKINKVSVTAMLLATTACGGGSTSGGGGAQPLPPPPPIGTAPAPTPTPAPAPAPAPTPAPPPISQELLRSQGALAANAQSAYNTGLTGAGVIVAVIDSGIDISNPEFAGRIHPDSKSLSYGFAFCLTCAPEPGEFTLPLKDISGHGTAVTSLALAAANGSGIQGVAPGATLLAIKAAGLSVEDKDGIRTVIENLGSIAKYEEGIVHAVNTGAFVINMSFGGVFIPDDFGSVGPDIRAAMELVREKDVLIVKAISNVEGEVSSENSARNVMGSDDFNKANVLLAIGLKTDLSPLDSIGTPGTYADRTLAVVSQFVNTLALDNTLEINAGNSMAAPIVTGAAALLKERWPQLGGRNISRILLDSARDLGEPGIDQVYGVGLLDIERALAQPVTFVQSSSGSMFAASTNQLTTSGAFGDASATLAPVMKSMSTIDVYGRDWEMDLSGQVSVQSNAGPRLGSVMAIVPTEIHTDRDELGLISRQQQLTSNNPVSQASRSGRFAFRTGDSTVIEGSLNTGAATGPTRTALRDIAAFIPGNSFAITHENITVSASSGRQDYGNVSSRFEGQDVIGQRLTQIGMAFSNGLSMNIAQLNEQGQMLGTRGFGALATARSDTTLVSMGYSANMGSVRVGANASYGQTRAVSAGILSFGRIESSAFDGFVALPVKSGAVSFTMASPLHITNAPATLTVARGFDLATNQLRLVDERINLAPSSREIELGINWSQALPLGRFDVGLRQSFNAGHIYGVHSTALWFNLNQTFK